MNLTNGSLYWETFGDSHGGYGTHHPQVAFTSAAFTAMQSDGNFVMYDSQSNAIWATNTNGHSGAFLNMQDDSNLVIYTSGNAPLWSLF